MGLLQKRQDMGNTQPLYTIGGSKVMLIIGLGNPEAEYDSTRHNVGFAALDYFAEHNDFPGWIVKKDLKCQFTSMTMGGNRVILIKPQTYMNLSGESANAVQRFYRVYNESTIVVYDELALPFGQIRTRAGGESAGHNGVKSLIEHIGEEFGRVRIGIANDISAKADAANFVLGKFTKQEQKNISLLLQETNVLLNEYVVSGSLGSDTRSVL